MMDFVAGGTFPYKKFIDATTVHLSQKVKIYNVGIWRHDSTHASHENVRDKQKVNVLCCD
jgi:hypothetical protein